MSVLQDVIVSSTAGLTAMHHHSACYQVSSSKQHEAGGAVFTPPIPNGIPCNHICCLTSHHHLRNDVLRARCCAVLRYAVAVCPGFVESFNISVAAALIMYEAQQQRARKLGTSADLSHRQQEQLLAAFLMRGVVSQRDRRR